MVKSTGSLGVLIAALLCPLVTGCGGDSKHLKAFLQQPRSPVSAKEYRVLPPDVIQITSLQVPDINNIRQQVRPDGKINLPLLGEVYVADQTPLEIEKRLIEKSHEFYEKADATVQVTDYRSQKVYVFGQVTRPGPVPWTGADTLIDVLAQVQPTTLAWPERIRVVRAKPPQRGGYMPALHATGGEKRKDGEEAKAPPKDAPAKADGPPKEGEPSGLEGPAEKADVMIVNLMAMMKKGNLSRNVLLKADDVIYVPPNPLAAVGLAIQQLLLGIQPATQTIQLPASAIYSVKSVENIGGSKSVP